MKRYRIHLRGNNLLLNIDGEHRRCGFTSTLCLKDLTEEQARKTATIRVHHRLQQQFQMVEQAGLATEVAVEKVEEVGWLAFTRGAKHVMLEFYADEDAAQSA